MCPDYQTWWSLFAFKWRLRRTFCMNVFPHVIQRNGLSPVWIRRWDFRLHFWVNPFPQKLHLCGFSPVWTRLWILKAAGRAKVFPQNSHDLPSLLGWNGGMQMCDLHLYLRGIFCLQILQKFDLWDFMCIVRVRLWKKVLLHIWHVNMSSSWTPAVSTLTILKSLSNSSATAGMFSEFLRPPLVFFISSCWISSGRGISSSSSIGILRVLKASSVSLMDVSCMSGSSIPAAHTTCSPSWSNDRLQVLPWADLPTDSGSSAVLSSCSVAWKNTKWNTQNAFTAAESVLYSLCQCSYTLLPSLQSVSCWQLLAASSTQSSSLISVTVIWLDCVATDCK